MVIKRGVKNNPEMNVGAVGFIDLLGWKGIWQHRKVDEILYIFKELKTTIGSYSEGLQKITGDKGDRFEEFNDLSISILSDTVVITIISKNPKSIIALAPIINEVLRYFGKYNLFARGAIAYGEYINEESTFVGPAIDDVSRWYEFADWIGVILTPRTSYLYDTINYIENYTTIRVENINIHPYIKYDIPVKVNNENKLSLNALNWPGFLYAKYRKENNELCSEDDLSHIFKKMIAKQSVFDISVYNKYEHSLRFIDHCVSEVRKLNKLNKNK